MHLHRIGLCLLLACSCWARDAGPNQAAEIVHRSVANTNADRDAAPQYDFTERDTSTHNGKQTSKTYQVMTLEGSQYSKWIATNGKPLSKEEAAEEEAKFQREISRRHSESPDERRKRIAQYEKERSQDHALMTELAKAFEFKLVGDEAVNGRQCFVLDATPKSGYNAPTRETQVLKGMRGRLWVDKDQYQWVKVHAEVFRPVSFGLFIASVKPGTEFTLEQKPVQGNLWLPSHFSMRVRAKVLVISKRTNEDEVYSNYHRAGNPQANAMTT